MGKSMKLKLVKIVYGYDIERDGIVARQSFVPSGEDDPVDRDTGDGDTVTLQMETVSRYTREEWDNLLYSLRSRSHPVEIKSAAAAL